MVNMVSTVQRSLSRAQEFAIDVDNDTRVRVLRGLFESFYAPMADRVVFDTNRAWTVKLALLGALFPETKLICCVRSVNAILESFERVFRENLLETSAMFGFDPEINVYGRVDRLMVPGGVVGVALNGLKEAFYGPDSDRMLLVGYDRLATAPKLTLEAIYDFIGEPVFTHDFANVGFAAQDFDAAFGMNGLHTVRGTVARITRQPTLPPDLSALFQAPEFWHAPDKTSKATCLV